MNIVVKDLIVNRVELDNFLDGMFDSGNPVSLKHIEFVNLTLTKDKPQDLPFRLDEEFVNRFGDDISEIDD